MRRGIDLNTRSDQHILTYIDPVAIQKNAIGMYKGILANEYMRAIVAIEGGFDPYARPFMPQELCKKLFSSLHSVGFQVVVFLQQPF